MRTRSTHTHTHTHTSVSSNMSLEPPPSPTRTFIIHHRPTNESVSSVETDVCVDAYQNVNPQTPIYYQPTPALS